jgi:predicted Rossmann fold flavoprotein
MRAAEARPDVVVAGAGPAGLMAAIAAARAGRRVVVLERMPRPGLKLLATGGGHCNLTNLTPADAFLAAYGRNGRFAADALRQMGPADLRDFFRGLGVPTVAQDTGLVFPASGRAGDVLAALLNEAARLDVEICCDEALLAVDLRGGAVAAVRTGRRGLACERVVLATGGLGYPALGGTDLGLRIAEQSGHRVTPPLPALAPLVTRERWPATLAGIGLRNVAVTAALAPRVTRTADLLFTHRGISGPVALDLSGGISAGLTRGAPVAVTVDLLGAAADVELARWRNAHGTRTVLNCLAERLPRALAEVVCAEADIARETRASALRREQAARLAMWVRACPLTITATEGFEHAMVTRGGVSLKDVAPRTLRSRRVSGLWLAGEVVDIDGPCGGYNLQWACASGHVAGVDAAGAASVTQGG